MSKVEWFGACMAAALVAAAGAQSGLSASAPAQSAARQASAAPGRDAAATQRALLDKYCVTCHNDRVKTANLSLQGADLAHVADHAELWEKVIRKMRAGVMPPPDMPRPPQA